MRRLMVIAATVVIAACGAKDNSANNPDDVEGGASGSLEAGTTVCINELVGVRYTLEDALRERELEPEASCMMADIQLEESGDASAWQMRYQRVGDEKWKECKSEAQERAVFAEECINQMIEDLGGS